MANKRNLDMATLRERDKAYFDAVLKWQERWTLSLAVGNGAGLAAVTGFIVQDLTRPVVGLLLPSAWIFVIGLVVSGVLPAIDLRKMDNAHRENSDLIAFLQGDRTNIATETVELKGRLLPWLPEVLSAGLFAAALAYPLVVLTKRLMLTGSFLG